jgi:hypothetical protein
MSQRQSKRRKNQLQGEVGMLEQRSLSRKLSQLKINKINLSNGLTLAMLPRNQQATGEEAEVAEMEIL